MKKIVRLELFIDNASYYYDRDFNPNDDNQGNCDSAFKTLCDAINDKKVIAVSTPLNEKLIPTIINTANVKIVQIDSVKVYDVKEPDGEVPPNDREPDGEVPPNDREPEANNG